MYKLITELYYLLTPMQRNQFWFLQVFVILMALFELISIASIIPFIAIVSDTSVIETNQTLSFIYGATGLETHGDFLLLVGVLVLTVLAFSSIVSMFTTWQLAIFAAKVGTEIGDRLFNYYLSQNWLFHVSTSSSRLTRNISTESIRVSDFVIQPLMQLNAKIVLVLLMSLAITIYEPGIALAAITIFVTAYYLLYKFVRTRLHTNGEELSNHMGTRFHLMNEGFGGIKDVILLGNKHYFINKFNKTGSLFASARGVNAGISQVPRYLMELVAFGSIVILILFLLYKHENSISAVLPVLSIYAFAGLKLLPALQQIYVNLSQVKGNISSFESIKEDLFKSKGIEELSSVEEKEINARLTLNLSRDLELKNITFKYGEGRSVLNNINLKIAANQVIGIVGPSGSGKSTLIDIILKLIEPQSGTINIDGEVINHENIRAWQNSIGFVPQSVFLTEGSIAENIAFGVAQDEINITQVEKVIKLAHLVEMVKQLPAGLDTLVGERGVKLSGGQRQRIAIARALYFEADILIFDEATSALDGVTEKMIMDAVHDFHGTKTIIMIAHRLKTVEKCDKIFLMQDGEITDQGSYKELLDRNEYFRKMAKHA